MRTKSTATPITKTAEDARVAIIRAQFNGDITTSLESYCLEALREGGIADSRIARFAVPGCFEIPIMAQRLAQQSAFDVIIALGAVIRGDTYHFELVAKECARGIMQVSLENNVPIIFEVLATYNRRDAQKRAGKNRFNKGIEAAHAALAMLAALKSAEERSS